MTIDERRAREKRERENPWRSVKDIQPDGAICELRTASLADYGRARFFLHDDDCWYQIDPPGSAPGLAIEARPTGEKLSAERRAMVVEKAQDDPYEIRGSELVKKPKRYKLHWRSDDEKGDK